MQKCRAVCFVTCKGLIVADFQVRLICSTTDLFVLYTFPGISGYFPVSQYSLSSVISRSVVMRDRNGTQTQAMLLTQSPFSFSGAFAFIVSCKLCVCVCVCVCVCMTENECLQKCKCTLETL